MTVSTTLSALEQLIEGYEGRSLEFYGKLYEMFTGLSDTELLIHIASCLGTIEVHQAQQVALLNRQNELLAKQNKLLDRQNYLQGT
jgi:hypothetical protein